MDYLGGIPQNYYTSALFDPLNMGNLMTPAVLLMAEILHQLIW